MVLRSLLSLIQLLDSSMLSDKHVEFAWFPKAYIGVPYIVITDDHRANLDVGYLNKAITKITFQYGPVRIIDLTGPSHGECRAWIATLSRDQHSSRQWMKYFYRK